MDVHAKTKLLKSSGDWHAYVTIEGGKKVYYASSFPKKEEGHYTKRGDVYFLITHRPDKNSFFVVSVTVGYPFKKDSKVTLIVDGKKFFLLTDGETAWAEDKFLDKKISEAIAKGTNMIVKGLSSRGTKTIDTYSLKGATVALRTINLPCGLL